MRSVCASLGNPIAQKIDPLSWHKYRTRRQAEGISAKHLNNELMYVKSVYNRLKKLKAIDYQNPLQDIEPLKIQEQRTTYLTMDQVAELRDSIRKTNKEPEKLLCIVDLCLATGSRWGEAENITKQQIQTDRVTFQKTKSKKIRTVQISPILSQKILANLPLAPRGTREQSFRIALDKCSFANELPRGQRTHLCRHTFASHFIANGGNLLVLQKILGHSSIAMTMRYAHLAPDYAKDAVRLNPIGQFLDNENHTNAQNTDK